MDVLDSLLDGTGYLPVGYCLDWTAALLWPMAGADGVIVLTCLLIPWALGREVRKRRDPSLNRLAMLFGAFALACGVPHAIAIWTLWRPDFGAMVLLDVTAAVVCVCCLGMLWPLIPKALKIASLVQLQSVIMSLQADISRRRSVEEQLLVTQQAMAFGLACTGTGFIATDRNGCVCRVNSVAEKTLGWTETEALGTALWKVFAPAAASSALTNANEVDVMIERGVSEDALQDTVVVCRDGVRRWMETKTALTYSADGVVRGMALIFRDVTHTKAVDAEPSRLAAIVESSFDAIIGKTLDGTITSWNRAAQELFGYSADEAIGQSVLKLMPQDRHTEELRILMDLAQGASVPAFDTVRLRKDGTPIDVSVTISPIRNPQGIIVGASKIARDVSSPRKAAAALRDSEARLRFALESARLGDWELDLATGAMRHSLRYDQCFGYDTACAEWNHGTFLRHVHPEDRPRVSRLLRAAVAEQHDWRVECRVVWPDASIHHIHVNASSHVEGGVVQRLIGIVSDVTERKLAERARLTAQRLKAKNRQIQNASRLKSQFLANMSHELRTPLNAIIGFADLLHSGAVDRDSAKHQMFLGHIGASGRHLLQLINDVLDLSKVESGKLAFFPEPVDLTALIKEVTDIQHTVLASRHIQLTVDVDPALGALTVDPARLKQVLHNYLSNAIKFTHERGTVQIRARAQGPDRFRLEVEDDGIGIAPSDLPRLFNDFEQLDARHAKHHAGTGLGLALTRRLVQAQGGEVGVRHAPVRGSIFYAVLDRVQPASVATPAAAVPAGPRLLVIDEDNVHQDRIASDLAASGFQVDAASTREQALRHAGGDSYDGIVLDLMMPDQGGFAVLEYIRTTGSSRDAPVVGVSMPAPEGAAVTFAVANVLSKPIRVDEIVRSLARFRLAGAPRANVLVIDDDAMALDLMRATLAGIGIDAVCVPDGRDALRDIERYRPDAIVLDLVMPDFDGFAVLDALRRMPIWQDTPVFIWTSMILTDQEYAMLSRSAQAILSKGGGTLQTMLDALRRWRPAREPAAPARLT